MIDKNLKRAIFLDRDGVLNKAIVRDGKPYPPNTLAEVEILPGVLESLLKLKAADYLLIVVTNQPDVARGKKTRQSVIKVHKLLGKELPLDEFYTCFHDDVDQCACRKPAPGLLFQAAEEYNIDLNRSYMIGDRWRDVEAGQRAGCKSIFIEYGYSEKQPDKMDYCVSSFPDAVSIILENLG